MAKKVNKSSKYKGKKGPVKKVNTQKKVVKVVKATPESEKRQTSTPRVRKTKETTSVELPFGKMNYILLLIGVGIIALGFLLMSLDDFVDATQFSISLYIAPVVVVAGFLEIIYAIMYTPRKGSTPNNSLE